MCSFNKHCQIACHKLLPLIFQLCMSVCISPHCSPTSAVIDSFNFANLTGEMVFFFFNCIPLILMKVSIFYYINWPSSLQVYPSYILYSFSPISEEETPLCWCPKRINFLRLPFFLLSSLFSIFNFPVFTDLFFLGSKCNKNCNYFGIKDFTGLYYLSRSSLVLSTPKLVKWVNPHICCWHCL